MSKPSLCTSTVPCDCTLTVSCVMQSALCGNKLGAGNERFSWRGGGAYRVTYTQGLVQFDGFAVSVLFCCLARPLAGYSVAILCSKWSLKIWQLEGSFILKVPFMIRFRRVARLDALIWIVDDRDQIVMKMFNTLWRWRGCIHPQQSTYTESNVSCTSSPDNSFNDEVVKMV